MASWDGSYDPDNVDYYVEPSINVPPDQWNGFLGNRFAQNAVPYPMNYYGYEQNAQYYNLVDDNDFSRSIANMPINNGIYTNNGFPPIDDVHAMPTEPTMSTIGYFHGLGPPPPEVQPQTYSQNNVYFQNNKHEDKNNKTESLNFGNSDSQASEVQSQNHSQNKTFFQNSKHKNNKNQKTETKKDSNVGTNTDELPINQKHDHTNSNNYGRNKSDYQNKNIGKSNVFFENNMPKYNERRFEYRDNRRKQNTDHFKDNNKKENEKPVYSKREKSKKYSRNNKLFTNDVENSACAIEEDKKHSSTNMNDLETNMSFSKPEQVLLGLDKTERVFENSSNDKEQKYNKRRDTRDPRDPRDSRDPRDPRDSRNSKDPRDSRNPRDPRDSRNPRDPRDFRDSRNSRDPRHFKDSRDSWNHRDTRDPKDYKDTRDPREYRDTRDPRDYRDPLDSKDPRESRDVRDSTDPRESREGAYRFGRNKRFERRENNNKSSTDWRQKPSMNNKVSLLQQKAKEIDYDVSQRERLTEQLNRGNLECLVCCDSIRQTDYVWSCYNCYHVLHLKCVQKWAKSSQDDSGWRCPACQNVTTSVPSEYRCFCGKEKNPDWNRRDVAHSCGEMCSRSNGCVHKCTLLCHPGSCPPCTVRVSKLCGCERTTQTQICSTALLVQCSETCDKVLNCMVHKCEKQCHHGSCDECKKHIDQECFCGKNNRTQVCIPNLSSNYSCGDICSKLLDCGNHKCSNICHSGSCEPCKLKPESVTHCCCGQTPISTERKSCLDPVPTCDKVCCRIFKCGTPSNPHFCPENCHTGDCPKCKLSTTCKCRCGFMDKDIPCEELSARSGDVRCNKKCTKKRSCGKHKCNQMCCIDIDHICPLPCSKTLSCGKHKCEQTCHKGFCQPCWRSSFTELYCECGKAVIFPPVPCGTRRPACKEPCSRTHDCDHQVLHPCNSDSVCPPCSVLTQKWCHGKHELRKAVPCHVKELSCGLPCGKPIPCNRHKCIQKCHSGPCATECTQPCQEIRKMCGHICAAPCHEGDCPDTPCKVMVKVTCQCGHRTMTRQCAENSRDYQRIASGMLASKMADVQLGHSIDLEEVFGQGSKKQNQLKTLECNDECKVIERNRRLTLGLQIVNPDLSGKLMPKYSDYMKQWAKKDAAFCNMVHDKLTELVQLAKSSKQKSRSYSFEVMNRDKRQFVHEMCDHFGCESQAYDQEPKRNVVATAVKEKCWLPSYSLVELVRRENGQRKVPGPMLNKLLASERSMGSLQLNTKSLRTSAPTTPISPSRSPEPEIDYFNYKG
ncbi:protein shuttle craft-like [Trichogramma pretiosum]|uniref:protein shuttle craft-like n=1 Tax=Trichogramma pretiosum TaxID=7493 RepID=UPI0006C9478F|nr:protein shuttle craft-like [Trichogramma pretiosum]